MSELDHRGASLQATDAATTWKFILLWIFATLVAVTVAVARVQPAECGEVRGCLEELKASPGTLNAGILCGLVTILIHEGITFSMSYVTAKPLAVVIPALKEFFMPSILVTATFVVLLLENLDLMLNTNAVLIHSTRGPQRERPVYTAIMVEWLVTVPILIVLAGHCALGRPLKQVTLPLVVTNWYIVIAWCALFVVDVVIQTILLGISFALYLWASVVMIRWATRFWSEAPRSAHSRRLRPCLCIGLVVVFGLYGVVFVLAAWGMLTSYQERAVWCFFNVTVKLSMSMAFSAIRSNVYHELLVEMLLDRQVPFQRVEASACPLVEDREVLTEPLLKSGTETV